MAGEAELAAILCAMLGGDAPEKRYDFQVAGEAHWIEVDCETSTHTIEVGLDDKRDSYDSLHQAIYASLQAHKEPMIVIIDTNGIEENEQYQIEAVATYANVRYLVVSEGRLQRWDFVRRYLEGRSGFAEDPGKIFRGLPDVNVADSLGEAKTGLFDTIATDTENRD